MRLAAEKRYGDGQEAKASAAHAFFLALINLINACSYATRKAVIAHSRACDAIFVAGVYVETVDYWWDHSDVRALRRVWLHKGLRLFVVFTTVMLLTSTIMYRPDHDGYQATHLFFMPRESWEMDGGRGMLYEESHYLDMDLRVLAAETYGLPSTEEGERGWDHKEYEWGNPATAGQNLASEEQAEHRAYTEASDVWHGPTHGPVLRKMPHAPNLTGNTIPLLNPVEALAADHMSLVLSAELVSFPIPWEGSIPTPPPRSM